MSGEASSLIEAVELSRDAVVAAVGGMRDDQGQYRPAPGEWSVCEILEHLYLAEVSGISTIWSVVEAHLRGRRWTDGTPHRGRHIEEIIGRTWRPREKSPDIATPRFGGPPAFWRSALCSLRPVLADVGRALNRLPLDELIVPHHISGPLDGRQRLEFFRFHLERHLLQIRRVATSPGFPAQVDGSLAR